ncbi:uncharacterized protein STEHIDRAFT_112556 [Stereum hirsutum FP-91666 SS1]|uniref:uncharacterized protein n=1 Tax=Stereum hirsutum (strain FP-91666) TaxID=721885 RepID=UPI000444A2F1|nr:uncharacterized protein STEHIDRAFT_112556 [Stereum hirsutum FP-91666 SS1]EIM85078.1 hypothetical protein STEHIDRAFT_112556 [Stereum hirsutum FP-91666 SS1]
MELEMENASRNKDVTLIDSQTNQALYRITNFQNSMFQSPKVNVISRLSRGSREERLAKLEKGWFNDHITINAGGARLKAKKFFDVAVFGGHYSFTGPDGRTRYRWELQNHGLRLTTDDRRTSERSFGDRNESPRTAGRDAFESGYGGYDSDNISIRRKEKAGQKYQYGYFCCCLRACR